MKKELEEKLCKLESVLVDCTETLKEIRKEIKYKPKKGDIVYNEWRGQKYIDIVGHVSFNISKNIIILDSDLIFININNCENVRPVTDEEKKLLFDKIHKKGKDFDFDKMEVVDYYPRAEKNGSYWFIDSLGEKNSSIDFRFQIDDFRYKIGNYSLTEDGLNEFDKYLKSFRK